MLLTAHGPFWAVSDLQKMYFKLWKPTLAEAVQIHSCLEDRPDVSVVLDWALKFKSLCILTLRGFWCWVSVTPMSKLTCSYPLVTAGHIGLFYCELIVYNLHFDTRMSSWCGLRGWLGVKNQLSLSLLSSSSSFRMTHSPFEICCSSLQFMMRLAASVRLVV